MHLDPNWWRASVLITLLVTLVACVDDGVSGPSGQTQLTEDAGSDAGTGGDVAAGDADTGGDLGPGDTGGDPGGGDDAGEPLRCLVNQHVEGEVCVCDEGFVESAGGQCVECVGNGECGDQVCSGFACRDCLSHDECGDSLFCGDDGLCTDVAPDCSDEGAQRCSRHRIQECVSEEWSDAPDVCPFGCDNDTANCYPEANVGWIGGQCDAPSDCTEVADAACLPDDEGFIGGHCTQTCSRTCPDLAGDTNSVTFCVDSEGLTADGMCVVRCDFDIYPDAGCRPAFQCREMSRNGEPGTVQQVCLPINWWRNPLYTFDYGITSGEVTATTATIWTRAGAAVELEVRYGTSAEVLDESATGATRAQDGFNGQVELTDLTPNTRYYYQVVQDGLGESALGTFQTARAAGDHGPVRFAYSADVDDRGDNLYDIFNVMRDAEPEFYLSLGDWPYADRATTEAAYHGLHADTRRQLQARQFLASTSIYPMFDDHEVTNDWDGAYRLANPEQVEMGLRVWSNWFPFQPQHEGMFYRRFRWGDLEFFLLDARSHRSARSEPDTLDKTMLGEDQLEWLLDGLAESDAVFKLIVTSVPLDFSTNGADAWIGYTAERDHIFGQIADGGVGGVVFLSADQHWFSANHHNSGFKEFQVGPISASLRQPDEGQSESIVTVVRDYNFGLVEYDPSAQMLTFEAINDDGDVIYSEVIRAGSGRIEVESTSGAPIKFRLCADGEFVACDGNPANEEPCTHVFFGSAPTTYEYAVPGPYRIEWSPPPGEELPDEDGCLEAGETLTFSAEVAPRTLPWSDDFSSDEAWQIVDEGRTEAPSNWSLGGGTFNQTSNIYDFNDEDSLAKLGTLAWNGSVDWEDYEFTVSFTNADNDGIGVIARYTDEDNYYRFSLDQQRSFARLVKRVDGEFVLLDVDDEHPGFTSDEWTEIGLRVDGNQVEALIDGLVVLSATDNSHSAGGVGLYVWGSDDVSFDDVEVAAE